MSWKTLTLTTADPSKGLAFSGRGSLYCEGTFGGGQVEVKPVASGLVASGFLDDAIDGSAVKTKDVPSGHYQLDLTGSTGASVTVYYNDQKGITI